MDEANGGQALQCPCKGQTVEVNALLLDVV